ncbi:helix-turn-helix transcriptional regulator [Parabacteroides sp. PF5-9]|uniref:helix-turn-helix domain-containing protein n=1 Tax=Parabacteroides sp. PF5-9 TaxID=1742404 RepID=UPI002476BA5B|nr:helix-turn-helix transcriptional regulator [Parabacteroides sp. PF5-9]MDH6357621.1 transcriptional regulator with XRE-family HTH domain [Parabacteroides sp. PF5-9]
MELRVKEICKQKGMLMEDLATKLGVTRITLTRNINGNPTLSTLEKIAVALGVEVIELFSHNRGDFTALIDHGGKLYRFDSIDELKDFIWGQIIE